jgi:hypothetical protein
MLAWFLLTTALCFIRAPDQPGVDISAAGTSVTVTPADAAVAVLAVACAARIARRRRGIPREAVWVLLPAAAFAVWLIATAVGNGSGPFVSAAKLVEVGVLAVAATLVLDTPVQVWFLIGALLAVNAAADLDAVWQFLQAPTARQPAFLGEHDFAALSTMTLSIWYAHEFTGGVRGRVLPYALVIVGAIGITLGAAFASLIGLYLALAAVVAVSVARKEYRTRALIVTGVLTLALTGAVVNRRQDNLGFLRAWFGHLEKNKPYGGVPGAWSQRLIFAYIGGRIFLAHPIFGTGWYPDLPPRDFVRFLADARRRFVDQPASYFPKPTGTFIPQMAYDQVLYELGLIGGALFLVLLLAAARASVRASRAPPFADARIEPYVAPAWMASLLGVLAGAALFGGIAIDAILWLTVGVSAALAVRLNVDTRTA